MSVSYSEKLKHPLWQRKRLEVLQAADFACEQCGATDKPLHVHHGYYAKGLEPWDYPFGSLHCLCEDCHRSAQFMLSLLHAAIAYRPVSELETILAYVDAMSCSEDDLPQSPAINPDVYIFGEPPQ